VLIFTTSRHRPFCSSIAENMWCSVPWEDLLSLSKVAALLSCLLHTNSAFVPQRTFSVSIVHWTRVLLYQNMQVWKAYSMREERERCPVSVAMEWHISRSDLLPPQASILVPRIKWPGRETDLNLVPRLRVNWPLHTAPYMNLWRIQG
jgi:hypothetical protein